MKLIAKKASTLIALPLSFLLCVLLLNTTLLAQDSTLADEEDATPKKIKPIKNTFESIWIIDNQTVMVPIKGTFEIDIMHRFGTVKNGYDDFWGFLRHRIYDWVLAMFLSINC